jgi:hypothetical protein
MDWPTILAKLPDAVPTLLGTLIGGCIGFFTAAGAQYLGHWFTRRRDAEKLRREKAEVLMDELFAQSDWLLTAQYAFYDASTPGSTLEVPSSDHLRTVQWFYFPELQQPIEALYEARLACMTFFRTHCRTKGTDYATWLKTNDPKLFEPVYQDYLTAWFAARDAVLAAAESRSWILRLLRRRSQKKQTPLKRIDRRQSGYPT